MITHEQKEKIREMRLDGMGYGKISEQIGISVNTVKAFCRRNNLNGVGIKLAERLNPQKFTLCLNCGAQLVQKEHRKRKLFCSDACRRKWWNAHPELVKRKAYYHITCTHCGKEFIAYGNNKRKYCCHECYIADRFGES